MTAKSTDRINFFLIWGCLFLATLFPFELFLFSYAVLGPLHYMTEINWLEKKDYFLRSKREKKNYVVIALVAIGLLTMAFFINEMAKWDFSKGMHDRLFQSPVSAPLSTLTKWGYTTLFTGFLLAVIYHLSNDTKIRVLFFCMAVLLTFLFFRYPLFSIWIGIFLPTIIHVFFFTILFMWSGTQRNPSAWGYMNLVSMGLVVWIIVSRNTVPVVNSVDPSTLQAFIASNFHTLNFSIGQALGHFQDRHLEIYSPVAWKIQVFIAFAYTYHYLNWFSKTSVISWHKVDRKKMRLAVIFWIASMVLYYLNYRLGFVTLFVLSMLHVILEFPLNVSTLRGLIRSLLGKPAAAKSPAA